MAFTEDINTFFGDFSENVFYDNETYKGILEQPDEVIADGVVLTTDYELTVKTDDLGTIDWLRRRCPFIGCHPLTLIPQLSDFFCLSKFVREKLPIFFFNESFQFVQLILKLMYGI